VRQIHKSFEVHDRYQFELKLDYWLDHNRQTDYQVDLFLFLPHSLGLNHRTYARDSFYDDIKNYVRLKTPEIPLDQVASLAEGQPGRLMRDSTVRLLDPAGGDGRGTNKELLEAAEYHTKMFVSIAVRALHNRGEACLSDLKRGRPCAVAGICGEIRQTLDLIRQLGREIGDRLGRPGSDRLPTVLSSADEYFTAEATQVLLGLLGTTGAGAGEDREMRDVLLDTVQELSRYQVERGFPGLSPDAARQDETVLFRHGIFKKFFRSPLFLSQERLPEGQVLNHVAMGFAAGLSMVFATLVAFLAQQRYGNYTLPLFVALVVGYIFKDRIKELTRVYLEKRLSRRLFDSKTHFFDHAGRKMGICREIVRFVHHELIPPEILKLRNKDHLTELANFWQAEKVIHYRKNVVLFR